MLSQPKRVALLVYLAVAAPRGFLRRDILLALFWPELDQERARAALRQALTFLRHELGDDVMRTRGAEEVGVDPQRFWCDAAAFGEAAGAGDGERALELSRGEFLPGFHVSECGHFEHWLEEQRGQLRECAVSAAERLAGRADAAGSVSEAVRWARRALELRPDNEQSLQRVLVALDRAGDRTGALREYDAFTRRLAAEYGTQPSPDTQAIALAIRANRSWHQPESVPLAAGDQPTRSGRGAHRGRIKWGAVALAGLLVTGYSTICLTGRVASPLRRDPLVVADFENNTGDSTLGHAVTQALRIDLSQSPAAKLLEGDALANALRRMGRIPGSALDPATAREVALREGAKAYVTGEIDRLGSALVLSARAVSAATGEVIAPVRETAADETRIIAAVDRLSLGLRKRLGESLATIGASQPLDKVTTSSLDALRSYTQAWRAFERGDYAEAIPVFERAIALDSTFAMAYRALAVALANVAAGRSRQIAATRMAFRYRERLPPRERVLTEATYYRRVVADLERSAAAFQVVLDTDPDDYVALANLAELYYLTHRYRESEALYRRATALTDASVVYRFLVSAQVAQGEFAAAETTLARFTARVPASPDALAVRARFAAARGDFATAASRFDSLRSEPGANWRIAASTGLANLALLQGRLAESERYRREAMSAEEQRGVPTGYLSGAVFLGTIALRHRNDPRRAVGEIEAALRRHPLSEIPASDRPYTELADLYARAGRVDVARRLMAEYEQEVDPALVRQNAGRHGVTGAIAMAEGRPQDAITAFRALQHEGDDPRAGLAELAEAYDRMGQRDSALTYYERLATTPALLTPPHYLGLAYRRLGDLYDQQGHRDKASASYHQLLDLWKHADADLWPTLGIVQARLAQAEPERSLVGRR